MVLELVSGVALVAAGGGILWRSKAVGAFFAGTERWVHQPRHGLLNRDRAERSQEAEADVATNRLKALVSRRGLLLAGAAFVAGALFEA